MDSSIAADMAQYKDTSIQINLLHGEQKMKHETPKEKKPRTTAQKWSRRAKIDEIIKELLAEKEEISVQLEQELKK